MPVTTMSPDTPIEEDENSTTTTSNGTVVYTSLLRISRVSYGTAGEFRCIASNFAGESKMTFHVTVQGNGSLEKVIMWMTALDNNSMSCIHDLLDIFFRGEVLEGSCDTGLCKCDHIYAHGWHHLRRQDLLEESPKYWQIGLIRQFQWCRQAKWCCWWWWWRRWGQQCKHGYRRLLHFFVGEQ